MSIYNSLGPILCSISGRVICSMMNICNILRGCCGLNSAQWIVSTLCTLNIMGTLTQEMRPCYMTIKHHDPLIKALFPEGNVTLGGGIPMITRRNLSTESPPAHLRWKGRDKPRQEVSDLLNRLVTFKSWKNLSCTTKGGRWNLHLVGIVFNLYKKGRNGNPIKNNEAVLIKAVFNNFWGIVLVVSITVELPQQINLSFS